MSLLALPAPATLPLLPAPLGATRPEVLLSDLLASVNAAMASETHVLYPVDEAHTLFGTRFPVFTDEMGYYLPSASLSHHISLLGSRGRGKSLLASSGPASSWERGQLKLAAVGGDDALLAQWCDLSPVDWTLAWQSWFPPSEDEPVPCVHVEEQSNSGMLLAVDVAWTCRELEERLAEKFPTLELHVWLASPRV